MNYFMLTREAPFGVEPEKGPKKAEIDLWPGVAVELRFVVM